MTPRASAVIAIALCGCGRTGLLVPDASRDGATHGSCEHPLATALAPPRPIAPLSTSFVTTLRPTLQWELADGSDGACLDLCRDRACNDRIVTLSLMGTSYRPTRSLAQAVTFWRLRSRTPDDAGTVTSPTWQFTVGVADTPVDSSWGSRMDLNGDGFGDIAVSATQFGGRAGRVYVFLGSHTGLGATPGWILDAPEGPQSAFGTYLGSAGDLDGDGFGDLAIGATGFNGGEGRAYVFFGGESPDPQRFARHLSPSGLTGFGLAPDGLGDIDGDGYGDFAIGQKAGQMERGQIFVYRGGAVRDADTPAFALHGTGDEWEGFFAAHAAGDFDGDRFADVIVPAGNFSPERGLVYLYRGTPSGLQLHRTLALNGGLRGYFGDGAAAGDVNGDGFGDILTGASGTSLYSGYVELYLGSTAGIGSTPSDVEGNTGEPYGYLTGDLSTVGDVNADGFDDYAVGASGGNDEHGYVWIQYGGNRIRPSVTRIDGSTDRLTHLGGTFSRSNDFDGDGVCDLAIGIMSVPGYSGTVLEFDGIRQNAFPTMPVRTIVNPSGVDDGFAFVVR